VPFTVTAFFKVNAILLCAVNFLFTFVGLFLNSLVLISLLNSQLRRKLCYFMILVLACFDLAVVVVFHPFIIIETLVLSWLFNTSYRAEDVNYIMRHLYLFSLTALITMTLEIYLAMDTNESRDVWTESSSLKNCFFISDIPSLWSRNVRHCGHGALFFVHVTSVKAQRPNDEHEAL
jgi:hypothetical protein